MKRRIEHFTVAQTDGRGPVTGYGVRLSRYWAVIGTWDHCYDFTSCHRTVTLHHIPSGYRAITGRSTLRKLEQLARKLEKVADWTFTDVQAFIARPASERAMLLQLIKTAFGIA